MAEQVEPLAGNTAVIQSIFSFELDHQPLPQVFGPHFDDLAVRLLEDLLAADLKAAMTGRWLKRRQFSS